VFFAGATLFCPKDSSAYYNIHQAVKNHPSSSVLDEHEARAVEQPGLAALKG
jgi:hypothetical protein